MQERADVPDGWRFIPPYDPTTYEPAEPARWPLRRRLAAFAVRWVSLSSAYTLAALAVLVLSGPQT